MSLRSIATACHCEAVAQHLLEPWPLNARIAKSQGTGGLGPWEAWPKVVSYRIRTPRFRSAAGLVFGPFLGIVRAPCPRAVPLRLGVWRGGLREPFAGLPRLCQSCAKGSFLPDSDAPFSVHRWPPFWCVFGASACAVPLRFPVLDVSALGTVFVRVGLLFGRHLGLR